jgi:hypothetical protein
VGRGIDEVNISSSSFGRSLWPSSCTLRFLTSCCSRSSTHFQIQFNIHASNSFIQVFSLSAGFINAITLFFSALRIEPALFRLRVVQPAIAMPLISQHHRSLNVAQATSVFYSAPILFPFLILVLASPCFQVSAVIKTLCIILPVILSSTRADCCLSFPLVFELLCMHSVPLFLSYPLTIIPSSFSKAAGLTLSDPVFRLKFLSILRLFSFLVAKASLVTSAPAFTIFS